MKYTENTVQELINTNVVYQLLSDKLHLGCCDQTKTLAQVCKEKKLNLKLVETLIKAYDDAYEFPFDELNQQSVPDLVQYLQASHTFYLEKKLPELEQTALHVAARYNDTHPLFAFLCLFFNTYKKKLQAHILYEEKMLFPYIKNLLQALEQDSPAEELTAVMHAYSTAVFEQNHSHVEDELQHIRKVFLAHSPESGLPLPYKVFLSQLQHFEVELLKHARIEDEVLIAKVVELEKQLHQRISALTERTATDL